jgi:hypothetical protein
MSSGSLSRRRCSCSPFLRYIVQVPNARTCVVSFRGRDGQEHSVVVSASSLYEAAARG